MKQTIFKIDFANFISKMDIGYGYLCCLERGQFLVFEIDVEIR